MNETEKIMLKLAALLNGMSPAPQTDVRNDARVEWIGRFLQSWAPAIFMAQGIRLDAATTAILSQELEQMMIETFDVEYPAHQAMKFFDVDTSINPGAEVVAYAQYDHVGKAKIIKSVGDDIPLVNVIKKKFTIPVVSIAAGYEIGFQQIRAALFANTPLQDLQSDAARQAIEYGIDDMAANGAPTVGIDGILTHASIDSTTPTTGGWATATADQIVSDIQKLCRELKSATLGIARATNILLGTDLYDIVANMQRSTASDITIKQWLLENMKDEGLAGIDEWDKLYLAGSGGTHSLVIAYEKSPKNISLVVPMAFTMHPPQARGLKYDVPCEARCGGMRIPYPKKIRDMDGC